MSLQDVERKYAQNQPLPATRWVLIIAFGIFLGNTLSLGLERAVTYWEIRQVAMAAKEAVQRSSAERAVQLEADRKAQAARLEQQRIESATKRDGYRQAKWTCDFWRQQVAKENSASNRAYRDDACSGLSQFR